MAHVVDISAKLEAVKPVLKLGPDEEYEINDDKNVILKMQSILEGNIEDADEYSEMFKVFTDLLGKDAVKEMEEKHPGVTSRMSQIRVLIIAISAAISGNSFEVEEKRFHQ